VPAPTFHTTIELFDRYLRAMHAGAAPGFNADLGAEMRERLEQLGWLVNRIQELEVRADAAASRPMAAFVEHVERVKREGLDYTTTPAPEAVKYTAGEARQKADADFEIKLLTEAFYYLAGRVHTLVKNKAEPLPGLKAFDPAGVRNVRNHLIEHPEGRDSRVFIVSWGRGGVEGPVLKSIRYANDTSTFRDPGLYSNAVEFRDLLEVLLHRALER